MIMFPRVLEFTVGTLWTNVRTPPMLYMIVLLDKCYCSTCVFVDVMFYIKLCYPSAVHSEEMLAFHLCYM